MMFKKDLPPRERAKLFLHFEESLSRKDLQCRYFVKGQYGYAPPGKNDMQLINSPVMWSLMKLVQGEYPSGETSSEKFT